MADIFNIIWGLTTTVNGVVVNAAQQTTESEPGNFLLTYYIVQIKLDVLFLTSF